MVRVEIEHDAMPAVARAVEHQPFLESGRADPDRLAMWDDVRHICDGGHAGIGLPSPPAKESLYDAQFNPKYMSVSVPTRGEAGSQ